MSKRVKLGSSKVAIAYIRASKDEQKLTLEWQRSALEVWAVREGVTIAAWFVDAGVSSKTPLAARPELGNAIVALRQNGAGVLLVAKRDRIARDVVLVCTIERTATASGARLVSAAGEASDGDTPGDRLMRRTFDSYAEYERDLIAFRTACALGAKRARGERVGSVRYGYTLADDGKLEVALAGEQAVIARARALRAEGASLLGVAKALAAEGMLSRTGRPFAASQVARMLAA